MLIGNAFACFCDGRFGWIVCKVHALGCACIFGILSRRCISSFMFCVFDCHQLIVYGGLNKLTVLAFTMQR